MFTIKPLQFNLQKGTVNIYEAKGIRGDYFISVSDKIVMYAYIQHNVSGTNFQIAESREDAEAKCQHHFNTMIEPFLEKVE